MNRRLRAAIPLAIVFLLAFAMPSRGQTKAAIPKPTEDSLESSPVDTADTAPASAKPGPLTVTSGALDFSRVFLALVAVIALILILRAFAKRVIPATSLHRASPAVKVMGRCSISAKQNLLVVQFGKRLVLVGDAGNNLNPLCEITDPDEVAAILAQTREETISVARRFESLFGRAKKQFSEDSEEHANDSFDDSHEIAHQDGPLDDTHKELSDLREKVRDVARQISGA